MESVTGPFRVGLLGHGTVGAAFAGLLPRHADRIELLTGLRPELAGIVTRSSGSFEEVLGRSDLIVELIGGIDPARDWVLRSIEAGRHVVTANKQLLSQHGEELWEAARIRGVQLRFEGAVAGVVPVIRVIQESLAGASIDRVHGIVNGTTNFILTEMARTGMTFEQALAEAQRLGYAEADPSEDVNGKDAAAKMAILARLAFDTPVHLEQVRDEGIEMIPPASTPPTSKKLEIVRDVVSAFYLHLEVADEPGVLAEVAQVLAAEGVSVRSVVQKGLGDQARLVMVMHAVLESRFEAAVERIARLDVLRAPPRAIRVLEEEFG